MGAAGIFLTTWLAISEHASIAPPTFAKGGSKMLAGDSALWHGMSPKIPLPNCYLNW